jgi:hypothetical protein
MQPTYSLKAITGGKRKLDVEALDGRIINALCTDDVAALDQLQGASPEVIDNACKIASSSGSLRCLRYTFEHNCPRGVKVCTRAAAAGYSECLQYALQNGYERGACKGIHIIYSAIRYNQPEACVRWLPLMAGSYF